MRHYTVWINYHNVNRSCVCIFRANNSQVEQNLKKIKHYLLSPPLKQNTYYKCFCKYWDSEYFFFNAFSSFILKRATLVLGMKKKKGTNDFLKQKLFEGVLHQGPPALGIYFLADILVLFARKIAALNGLCSSPLTSFLICIVLQISSLFIMHFLLKFVSFHLTRYSNI